MTNQEEFIYRKEYWTGDSRDGLLVNGDGYHYFKMKPDGLIVEAYEFYESDEGVEYACNLPEMVQVNWLTDLGFEDFEALDEISPIRFYQIQQLAQKSIQ